MRVSYEYILNKWYSSKEMLDLPAFLIRCFEQMLSRDRTVR